jgi:endonuclease/exonuclease/phosphatase family metal-dependent hydrolase
MSVVTLVPGDNLYIQAGAGSTVNYNADARLITKTAAPDYTRRVLLKIDTSPIPKGTVISKAVLRLQLTKADSSALRQVAVRFVTRSFLPAEATWRQWRTGQYWTTPGGDLSVANAATQLVSGVLGPVEWDVTALAQRAINNADGTRWFRVALLDVSPAAADSYRQYGSTRSGNGPVLEVTLPDAPPSSGGTLTVCQWNIHKCKGSDNVTNEARIGEALVKLKADVYSLNEVYYFWGVHAWLDQAAYLRDYLAQRLGGAWYRASANAYAPTGTRGYGVTILSRLPLLATTVKQLPAGDSPRAAVQVTVSVGGKNVNVFCTHLDYFDAAARTAEIHALGQWMPQFALPHVLAGDCNTRPGETDYKLIASLGYRDGWLEAKAAGGAVSPWPSGNTHGINAPTGGGSRFDYAWLRGTIRALRAEVFDMRVGGVWPSDHHPLKVTLQV